jgi:ribosomal protein L39E
MSTRAKKTRLSISVDPDLVEKLAEAAEAGYGGNVSRLITAVLWKEFLGAGKTGAGTGEKSVADSPPNEEVERCHRLLLRLRRERRVPSWVSLDTGEIVVDGQAFPYVKKWRLDASTAGVPSRAAVEALTRWAGRKKA